MQHCSQVKIVSTCDCGRKQATRDDPFDVKVSAFFPFEIFSLKKIIFILFIILISFLSLLLPQNILFVLIKVLFIKHGLALVNV